MKAIYKKMIKYKGVYHLANVPFSINSEDIQDLAGIGAEIIEEDSNNSIERSSDINKYLETTIPKLQDEVNSLEDISKLEELIILDSRKSAKEIYISRIQKLKEDENDVTDND